MNILNISSLSDFNSIYSFAFTDSNERLGVDEAYYKPNLTTLDEYASMFYEEFNEKLFDIESDMDKSAVLIDASHQPIEIMELLEHVKNGKYMNFLKRYTDGIVMGRNLEELDRQGYYMESLGASSSSEVSQEITDDEHERLIFIDSYNSIFNMLESNTEGDKAFTKFANILSIFSNEMKQAYYQSVNSTEETKGVYYFMIEALTDIHDHVNNGGRLGFVRSAERDIFNQALDMMIGQLDTYVENNFQSNDHQHISFQATA